MSEAVTTSPRLLATIGLPFSGKSTLSRELADALMVDRIEIDTLGGALLPASMTSREWVTRYRLAHQCIRDGLARGETVIFDAVNHRRRQRDRLRRLAAEGGTGIRFVWLDIPRTVVLDRLRRNRLHPVRLDVPDDAFAAIADAFQSPDDEVDVLRYDGSIPLARWVEDLADALSVRDDLRTDGGLAFRRC